MLPNLKARPTSGTLRHVPYGGLGGCVEVKTESVMIVHDHIHHNDTGRNKIRKKPVPIQVQESNIPHGPVTCPIRTSTSGLPASLQAGNDNRQITPPPPPVLQDNELKGLSPYLLWEKCQDNPWFATTSKTDSFTIKPVRRQQTMPAELPGSLLMPSQGYVQSNPPSTPPRPVGHTRTESESTFASPVPSLTHSSQSTPVSKREPRSTFSSPRDKSLPKLPPMSPQSSALVTKPFALMNVEQLLQVLPNIEPEDVMDRWIKMMEKELAKLRVYIFGIDVEDNAHLAALRPFCEETQGILSQAMLLCENHDSLFRRAQQSTNLNEETDLFKVSRMLNRLRDVTPAQPVKDWQGRRKSTECESLRTVLLECIEVMSNFVRNHVTCQLHQQCRGLSDRMVRILKEFDRGSSKRSSTASSFVKAIIDASTNTTIKPHHQPSKSADSAVEFLHDEDNHTKDLNANQAGLTPRPSKSTTIDVHDIIHSYFDIRSRSSSSCSKNDSHSQIITQASTTTSSSSSRTPSPEYGTLIQTLEHETQTLRKAHTYPPPPPLNMAVAGWSNKHTTRSITPPLISPPSPHRRTNTWSYSPPSPISAPASPTLLPISIPIPRRSPLRFAGGPLTSHPGVTSFCAPVQPVEAVKKKEKPSDNCADLASLHAKVNTLEKQNEMLREHLETLVLKLDAVSGEWDSELKPVLVAAGDAREKRLGMGVGVGAGVVAERRRW